MSQKDVKPRRRRTSLSFRVSFLLVVTSIIPLIIVVSTSISLARPALIAQANISMESDSKNRVQLIDTYLSERLLDAETLSQVATTQQFLATPASAVSQELTIRSLITLGAGKFRDKNYSIWSLFDAQGQLRLFYPQTDKPQLHGQNLVPPDYLTAVSSGKEFFSSVYFDPNTHKGSIDIYVPIVSANPQKYLGFIRASLNIDYIWNIVSKDKGANGDGSYAFILDQNGVRIADTDAARLFSSIATLSPAVLQSINDEARYGAGYIVPVIADQTLAGMKYTTTTPDTFQMTPATQNEAFQVTHLSTAKVPWTYFVLSPVNTVTAIANQQLLYTSLIAASVIVVAAIIGLIIGQRVTRPILASVENLKNNSQSLNMLATKQQSAATEQTWVVDSTQVGLQSVQYYTEAAKVAAHRLSDLSGDLSHRWDQIDKQTTAQVLKEIAATAQYIEQASRYQATSNQKLATAIKVTTQVTEQLATGATSAADAANQLENVVTQLRSFVGR